MFNGWLKSHLYEGEFLEVSSGIKDIKRCHTVSRGVKRYQEVSGYIKRYKKVSRGMKFIMRNIFSIKILKDIKSIKSFQNIKII